MRHRHHNTGVVAPAALHDAIGAALAARSAAVDHVHELGHDDVPLFTAEAVKGLEFDGVVVVNAHQILDGTALRRAPAVRGDDPRRAGAAPRRRRAASGGAAVRSGCSH